MEANAEREIIEELHEQLATLRDQLEGARARESFLLTLLEADRSADRETRLLALLEADRAELRELRKLSSPPPTPPRAADRRQPSALHQQILAAIATAPAGLTCAQVEAAVGTGQPLGNVLDGLARRQHITRLGKGVFGVAAELVDAASRNGTGP